MTEIYENEQDSDFRQFRKMKIASLHGRKIGLKWFELVE